MRPETDGNSFSAWKLTVYDGFGHYYFPPKLNFSFFQPKMFYFSAENAFVAFKNI